MKDKEARQSIVDLEARCRDRINKTELELKAMISNLQNRVSQLEVLSNKAIEARIPVCKTCGQKIQNGFKPGDIEQVGRAVTRK